MRQVINLTQDWLFKKGEAAAQTALPEGWEAVTLPHTWNAVDGQDGGNDYFRGTCCYCRRIVKSELPEAAKYVLEMRGANSSADVYVDGAKLAHHDGGYSTWRVDVTDVLKEESILCITVDNAENETVYPQVADFTFYGGLYREVHLLCLPAAHFMQPMGGPGVHVTPVADGKNAEVTAVSFTVNTGAEYKIDYEILDMQGNVVACARDAGNEAKMHIENAHRWHGRKDPYLYTLRCRIMQGDAVIDEVSVRFGVREYEIDPERGFILNGEEYPLRGVSRHQDRWGIGNALKPEHHKEDMDLICEVGATTIRLAHYQHDQYFYDLCDERGMVVWAEIPYISRHMPGGRENTISQMRELIAQNYNHASIVVWGLSNEISMGGTDSDLLENHNILNDMVHQLDPTRKTVIACLSACKMDDPYVHIPDAVSYNHYFGWYGGDTSMNGPWFDKFHEKYPGTPIGCSEYGCEALNWHTSDPKQGDYTEEYQAYYHEELIKQLFTRKYLWATHVWNMFDFGADARSEGGENGQNHKGLITMDRKYKKDAFYAYKAWLSDEPFVHICGKRYVDRVEETTKVTVYSNLPEVELFANGASLGKKQAADHFFYFDVPNAGETALKAVAGDCTDESRIKKVEEFNEAYRLKEQNAVLNWFDITEPEGYYSINDTIANITKSLRGKLVMGMLGLKMYGKMKKKNKGGKGKPKAAGFSVDKSMLGMLGGFTLLRLSGLVSMVGISFTKEELLSINKKLNRIRKKN